MDKLASLRKILNDIHVTDDMISRGVRLTSKGMVKLANRFKCSTDEIKTMITDLGRMVRDELKTSGLVEIPGLYESNGRFEYESDVLGNITIRDTKSGATRFLQGSEAFQLIKEIERNHPDYQGVIAPYFNKDSLMEFADEDVATDDMGNTGGTYNFPHNGNFACARFWLANHTPHVEVVRVVNQKGEDVHLDDRQMAEANKEAWEWIDKV